jgi:hypothetical protein
MKHFAPDPWCGGRSADRLPQHACAPHETGRGNPFTPMNPMPHRPIGRVEFVPYDKFPTGTSPAPSALELARLYDRAAEQVALLVYALRLSTPRNQLAFDARQAALAAVEFDLQS